MKLKEEHIMKKLRRILAAILVLTFLVGMSSVALAAENNGKINFAAITTTLNGANDYKDVFHLDTKAVKLTVKVTVGSAVSGEEPDIDTLRLKYDVIDPSGKRIGEQVAMDVLKNVTESTQTFTNVKAGNVKVRVITADQTANLVYTVKVTGVYQATISKTKAAIKKGQSLTLTTDYAGGMKKTWSSSDKKVATVSDKGVVKGVGGGNCTITCKAGDQTLTCKLTVYELPALGETVYTGNTYKMKVLGASSKDTLTWSSDKPAIATINKGKLTALKAGTVKISVDVKSNVDGVTRTLTRTIVVKQNPYPKTMTVIGNKLALRAKPSTKGAIILRIPKGKKVTVTGIDNGWAAVTYGGKKGYVMKKYLK